MSKKIFLWVIIVVFCIGSFSYAKTEPKMKTKPPPEEEKQADNPFGVLEFLHWNHEWNNYKYSDYKQLNKVVALIKEAGIGWVRMDFVWGDVEAVRGKFDFNKYDYLVDLLYRNKIQLLGILDYSADWASTCGAWNCRPKDNAAFVNFAAKVVARYKDRVKYWEVWNEPDSRTYWVDQDSLKSYCVLLKDTYIALKKVDPECKILNGGFANGIASINHLYDNGAKDYFDILNIHIFESPLNKGAEKRLLPYPKLAYKIMQRNGDGDKKIWITEIGCPGVKRGSTVSNWWMGNNPTEKQQAAWVKQVYKQLLTQPYVEKVFWAFFRDCNKHWSNGVDYFGLVRWDFSKKAGFAAYKNFYKNWIKTKKQKKSSKGGQ